MILKLKAENKYSEIKKLRKAIGRFLLVKKLEIEVLWLKSKAKIEERKL